MSSNPRRGLFGRRPAVVHASNAQVAGLTAAFFECEQRLTDVGNAVDSVHAARIPGDPTPDWHRLREQYDAILEVYLRVSVTDSDEATPDAVDDCLRSFHSLVAAIDEFAARHGRTLDAGRSAALDAARAAQDARIAAGRASNALADAPIQFATLATVRTAADTLSRSIAVFEAAAAVDRSSAATAVTAAAQDLETRLASAPGLADDAERTLRSLTTRGQALKNRLADVPAVISTLLREFSAGCSADLTDSEARAQQAIDDAHALLGRAGALAQTSPDESLAIADRARDRFTEASEILDRVFDRQTELRAVRADPQAEAKRVRFRLRDAQLLAMNHDLVREWGSVLDAQSDRIERAGDDLARVHPDYWSYLTQLRMVDVRITEIVDRMRHRIANP